MEHTKLPLKISEGTTKESCGDYFKNIYSNDGFACARAYGETVDECIANTLFVVKACNSHDELLAACINAHNQIVYLHEKFEKTGTGEQAIAMLKSAITKAEGR